MITTDNPQNGGKVRSILMVRKKGGSIMLRKFWMVIGHDSATTSVRHYKKEEADNEAERLVKKENKPFILLEAMELCKPKEIQVIWHGMREEQE